MTLRHSILIWIWLNMRSAGTNTAHCEVTILKDVLNLVEVSSIPSNIVLRIYGVCDCDGKVHIDHENVLKVSSVRNIGRIDIGIHDHRLALEPRV